MCDFYVAVNHRNAICYIIPMSYADDLDEKSARNVKIDSIQQYKEAWHLFNN